MLPPALDRHTIALGTKPFRNHKAKWNGKRDGGRAIHNKCGPTPNGPQQRGYAWQCNQANHQTDKVIGVPLRSQVN